MAKLRPITQDEWELYQWVEVRDTADSDPIYIRAIKKTSPPNDGYVYRDATPIYSDIQVWKRLMTHE